MNWPKRMRTNTQQAPPPLQSSRLVPFQVASRTSHCIKGTEIHPTMMRQITVIAASTGVANRRWRSQATVVIRSPSARHRVTSRWRALYQFMNSETARLSVR
jgi:hypothetical protein